VPSKRQPSKQRRAAQNRASRQALAARTEAASQPRQHSSSSSTAGSAGGESPIRSGGGGLLSGLFGGGGGGGGGLFGGGGGSGGGGLFGGGGGRARGPVASGPVDIRGAGPGGRTPGQTAVRIALALGVLSFLTFAFLTRIPVDDRGDPVLFNFQAARLDARSILTGQEVVAEDVTVVDAFGPAVLLAGLIPLVILVAVFVRYRQQPSSRPLTIGMLALAGAGFIVPSFIPDLAVMANMPFLLALVAVAVGSFQARRAEMTLRMADQAGAPQPADDEDLDDEYDDDVEDEYDDEDVEEDEYDDEDLDEDDEYDDEDVEDESGADEYEEDAAEGSADDYDEDAAERGDDDADENDATEGDVTKRR
jgi:hypothetical protein